MTESPEGKKSQLFKDLDISTKLLSIFKSVKDKKEIVHMLVVDFRKKTLHRNPLQSIKIFDFNYILIWQGL